MLELFLFGDVAMFVYTDATDAAATAGGVVVVIEI